MKATKAYASASKISTKKFDEFINNELKEIDGQIAAQVANGFFELSYPIKYYRDESLHGIAIVLKQKLTNNKYKVSICQTIGNFHENDGYRIDISWKDPR